MIWRLCRGRRDELRRLEKRSLIRAEKTLDAEQAYVSVPGGPICAVRQKPSRSLASKVADCKVGVWGNSMPEAQGTQAATRVGACLELQPGPSLL